MIMDKHLASLLFVLVTYYSFTATVAGTTIPILRPSADVLTSEGASFSFSCIMYEPQPVGWYLQVFKKEIVVQTFDEPITWDGEANWDEFIWVVSIDLGLDPRLPRNMASRYNVTRHHDYGVTVHVTDAVASDSGQWACRVSEDNSTMSVGMDSVITGGSNITVLTPLLDMRFFEVDDVGNWQHSLRYVTDNVTLNAEEPKIFGCQVWINIGVPELTGSFWGDGPDVDEIDASKWHIDAWYRKTASYVDWEISANLSGLLWTRTQDHPDVGNRNGSVFTCQSLLPLIGAQEKNITVFSSTPPLEPEVDNNSASQLVFQLVALVVALLAASVNCG